MIDYIIYKLENFFMRKKIKKIILAYGRKKKNGKRV
jgi:hypothetical protein